VRASTQGVRDRRSAADATPAEIGDVLMGMLRDQDLHAACRSFAARVSRFDDLARAADLVPELVRVN